MTESTIQALRDYESRQHARAMKSPNPMDLLIAVHFHVMFSKIPDDVIMEAYQKACEETLSK